MKPIDILLVEDDQVDVMDIKRSLNKLNIYYNLVLAKNGEEALKCLLRENRSFVPDFILIDLNMPKMNGLELLKEIKNDKVWSEIKCFIITTSNDVQEQEMAKKYNISGYIIKPLTLDNSKSFDSLNLMIDLINFK